MKKAITYIGGLLAGLFNGLLGAGGGMLIVPSLSKSGLEQQKAHATSVCVILPICIFSSAMYIYNNRVAISDALPYLGWGIVGALLGTWFLQKLKPNLIRKAFGILMIWAAFRMVFR